MFCELHVVQKLFFLWSDCDAFFYLLEVKRVLEFTQDSQLRARITNSYWLVTGSVI